MNKPIKSIVISMLCATSLNAESSSKKDSYIKNKEEIKKHAVAGEMYSGKTPTPPAQLRPLNKNLKVQQEHKKVIAEQILQLEEKLLAQEDAVKSSFKKLILIDEKLNLLRKNPEQNKEEIKKLEEESTGQLEINNNGHTELDNLNRQLAALRKIKPLTKKEQEKYDALQMQKAEEFEIEALQREKELEKLEKMVEELKKKAKEDQVRLREPLNQPQKPSIKTPEPSAPPVSQPGSLWNPLNWNWKFPNPSAVRD